MFAITHYKLLIHGGYDDEEMVNNTPDGGLPYKNDGGSRRKFWKEPLKGTRISISGRGLN